LIHLLRNARGSDRQTIGRYLRLGRSERTAAMVSEIRGLLNDYGSIAFAAAYARGIAGAALEAFESAFAPATAGPDRDFVRAAVPYMLDRRA
jgi:geranylgeranyl diphosphate synthase, type II